MADYATIIPHRGGRTEKPQELTDKDNFLSWININHICRPLDKDVFSLQEELCLSSSYLRIALSWSPSSWKSTVAKIMNDKYSNVYVFPEIATEIIKHIQGIHEWVKIWDLFGDQEFATRFEHLVLLIRKMQKEYADTVKQWLFISDRAVVEWYHFMNISSVPITPNIVQGIKKIKEDLIFLFETRQHLHSDNVVRYEPPEFAIQQEKTFKEIIPRKWGYEEWKNYFIVPTYLDTNWEVSQSLYDDAGNKRIEYISKILNSFEIIGK